MIKITNKYFSNEECFTIECHSEWCSTLWRHKVWTWTSSSCWPDHTRTESATMRTSVLYIVAVGFFGILNLSWMPWMNSSEHQPREEPSITILKSLERPVLVMKKGWGEFGVIHWVIVCKYLFLCAQSRLVEKLGPVRWTDQDVTGRKCRGLSLSSPLLNR